MGSTMNLVMTSFGFAVSAIFIIFVLARLLCARLRSRNFRAGWAFGAAVDSIAIERGANGMDLGAVSLFPTIKYTQDVFASIEDATCTICLIGYEEREILRILPQCGHAFHVKCIDAWLRQQSTCPICRVYLQSSPLRRNMPSPLLSMAARSRFSPGAIPESFFEQPLSSFNSPTSTLGQSPHKCEMANSFQGCDGSCEQRATKVPGVQDVCIDLERSMHLNSRLGNSYLGSKQFGEGAESPSDDDLWDTANSISEHRRGLEEQRPWRLSSCNWVREEAEAKVGHGAIMEERSEGGEVKDVGSSEKGGERVCISVEKAEKNWVVASSVEMVGTETGGVGEGEANGSLDKQKAVNKDWSDTVDGNSNSLEERENGSQLSQERHSFSLWIGKEQEGCMQQTCTQTMGDCLVEAETERRPAGVSLGWTPVTFYSSFEDDTEATTKLDGSTQINPSTNHENIDMQ